MASEFQDKHVVVTGGTGALGHAVVKHLVKLGAICHVPCFESAPQQVPLTSDRVEIATGVDLTDEKHVNAYFSELPELWASVHTVGGFAMAPITETSLADFERMFSLNTISCFLCCREAVRIMRRSGPAGRIVNVAARPAVEPAGGMAAYAASKAAVASLTRSLAVELRDEQIWVNGIVPSIIDSPANRQAMPGADFDSWPKPADIAEVVAFLASPQNQLTSGALVPVYGMA